MGIFQLFLHLLRLAVISCFQKLPKIHLLKLISLILVISLKYKEKSPRLTVANGYTKTEKGLHMHAKPGDNFCSTIT